jgi:TRAP-type C4-dicarboxylate transport system permease small subunit
LPEQAAPLDFLLFFATKSHRLLGKKAIGLFANLVSTAFFSIISYYCVSLWDKLSSQRSPALMIPMSYVYLGIILGSVFMGLYYLWSTVASCLPRREEENTK